MDEADNLRRQAKRALRLAEALSDQYSTQALKTLAATLLEQVESLEQKAQPEQRIQPRTKNSRLTLRPSKA